MTPRFGRKAPKQGRSRELVGSVLEAATRILNQGTRPTVEGLAAKAGVSVGSLYQYFTNVEDVFAGVWDRQVEENVKELKARLVALRCEPVEVLLRELTRHTITLFFQRRVILRELYHRVPRRVQLKFLEGRWQMAKALSEVFLERGATDSPEVLERKCFVMCNAVMGVLHTLVLLEGETYTPNEVHEDLVRLSLAILDGKVP